MKSIAKKNENVKQNVLSGFLTHCVSVPMTPAYKARKNLEKDMRAALAKRQGFLLYFQPEIDVSTMQIVGWEALLRWHHPEKGMLSPDVFIPILLATSVSTLTGFILVAIRQKINLADRTLLKWLCGFVLLILALTLLFLNLAPAQRLALSSALGNIILILFFFKVIIINIFKR